MQSSSIPVPGICNHTKTDNPYKGKVTGFAEFIPTVFALVYIIREKPVGIAVENSVENVDKCPYSLF